MVRITRVAWLGMTWWGVLPLVVRTVPALSAEPCLTKAGLRLGRRLEVNGRATMHPIEARTTAEIEPAFREAMRNHPRGMIVVDLADFQFWAPRDRGARSAPSSADARPVPGYENDGGLVSYGPEVMMMYAQAGTLAVKDPEWHATDGDSVERPTRITFAFNLKTAKRARAHDSADVAAAADHVIE
jgi:hypothetical protein